MANKRVTQAELRSLVGLGESLDLRAKQIRRRIDAGAAVEPGRYSARSEGDDPSFSVPCSGLNVCGLEVAERESWGVTA